MDGFRSVAVPDGLNSNILGWLGSLQQRQHQRRQNAQHLAALAAQQQAMVGALQAELNHERDAVGPFSTLVPSETEASMFGGGAASAAAGTLATLTTSAASSVRPPPARHVPTTSLSEDHQFVIEEYDEEAKRHHDANSRNKRQQGSMQPAVPSKAKTKPSKAPKAGKNGVYIVETILAHKGEGANKEVLVQWRGYGNEHNSWEPADAVRIVTNSGDAEAEEAPPASLSSAAPPEKMYVVEKLVSRRRRGGRDEVFVKWAGYCKRIAAVFSC